MAKIILNNKNYEIDEQSLSTAINALKSHLSTTMAGTGAKVSLGGVSYNIDSTKLSTATNAFTTHLGTISGNGAEVVVNGTKYSVDSTKLSGAISALSTAFDNLSGGATPDTPTEERLEGDGAEYYTLAPTALSFRSTAPLNELQEVQINGVTVDPANYTLEEGSTIVTFPIEYLKTLNVGDYEVMVASDSKSVKGDFTVKAPELNEYGFYYNQPYTAYVVPLGLNVSFFVRDGGTFDSIDSNGAIDAGTYEISGNTVITNNSLGTLHSTISEDGTEIYCTEIATTFKLSNSTFIAADEDYIYVYKENLGGYEVKVIDKTKTEYGAIKTGINGIDTVALEKEAFAEDGNQIIIAPDIPNTVTIIGEFAFNFCSKLRSIIIPDSVTKIGKGAFRYCSSLSNITFEGTVAQWSTVALGESWAGQDEPNGLPLTTHVHCIDGQVAL